MTDGHQETRQAITSMSYSWTVATTGQTMYDTAQIMILLQPQFRQLPSQWVHKLITMILE